MVHFVEAVEDRQYSSVVDEFADDFGVLGVVDR